MRKALKPSQPVSTGTAGQVGPTGDLERLRAELREALERQAAVSEVLRTINSSAFDLQAVFSRVCERAAGSCDAFSVALWLRDGDQFSYADSWSEDEESCETYSEHQRSHPFGLDSPGVIGRAYRAGKPVMIENVHADPDYPKEQLRYGQVGTLLGVPLMKDGVMVGGLSLTRRAVRLFSGHEIELVQTFADQAVIAIENARLFNETKDALEQQTAIRQILETTSRSAFDVVPVMQAIAERSAALCEAEHAWVGRYTETRDVLLDAYWGLSDEVRGLIGTVRTLPGRLKGTPSAVPHPLDAAQHANQWPEDDVAGRQTDQRDGTRNIEDSSTDPQLSKSEIRMLLGLRSWLHVPLVREGLRVGAINLGRSQPGRFTDAQVRLVQTFAAQAVIAMENVRLFNETKEALERQTAISEILRAIAGSPSDERPVLQTIAASAARYTGAPAAVLFLARDRVMWAAGYSGSVEPTFRGSELPLVKTAIAGRAILERKTIHVADIAGPEGDEFPDTRERAEQTGAGARALLAAPLVQGDRALGALYLRKTEPIPFTSDQIQLVETFANQAVIAIENVRLFNETKEQSRQLETMNQELAAASKHKSEFLANMSHELRTPLNAVIGFSEVLLQKMFGELNEQQTDYVRDISSSGRHLLDLVNEILDLSKIEAGRMELEPTEFDLANTISGAVMFVRERAGRHSIELASEVPDDLGTVVADERKVRQVLLNLLSNAVKFTPDGGAIGVRARRGDGEVEVSVRDTGIGIAPEDQPRVFEEFQQVGKPSDRSREGTGLGLALAKRFVELHGGRMWLDSEVGKGTTFTFAIPTNTRPGTSA